jgi:tRNA threonylcarbamoyladenosine biosynthesis protein TsaE
MRIELVTRSEDETIALGRALGPVLRAGDVVALHGELGAGKTRLVRGIAGGMGLDERLVSSPTFVMVNEYERPPGERGGESGGRPSLVHVDAYRMTGADDLDTLGWDRLTDGGSVVVVEWAERIEPALGPARLDVRLEAVGGEDVRRIMIEGDRSWSRREGWEEVARLSHAGDKTTSRSAEAAAAPLPAGWARCPISGKPVSPDSPTFPFFDEKCRMADLGRWFGGTYSVRRELMEEDLDDPDLGER